MRRAHPGVSCELGERYDAIFGTIEQDSRARDRPNEGRLRLPGMAPPTGAKARAFGGIGIGEEAHVLARWPTGRTRRPAVDSGRGDCKEEFAVALWVAGDNCFPVPIFRRIT